MQEVTLNIVRRNFNTKLKEYAKVGNAIDGSDLNIKSGKYLSKFRGAEMKDIDSGFGVILISPIQKFIAHISAQKKQINPTVRQLEVIIDDMRKEIKSKDGDVVAIVAGGVGNDSNHKLTEESLAMEDAILTTFEKYGVDKTAISEKRQTGLGTYFNIFAQKNEVTIWDGIMNRIRETLHSSPEEVADTMEEYFNYVEISPNMKVNIVDEIPKNSIK